jgi:hypothetical protein
LSPTKAVGLTDNKKLLMKKTFSINNMMNMCCCMLFRHVEGVDISV